MLSIVSGNTPRPGASKTLSLSMLTELRSEVSEADLISGSALCAKLVEQISRMIIANIALVEILSFMGFLSKYKVR